MTRVERYPQAGPASPPFGIVADGGVLEGWVGAGVGPDAITYGMSARGFAVAIEVEDAAGAVARLALRLLEEAADAVDARRLAEAVARGTGGLAGSLTVAGADGESRLDLSDPGSGWRHGAGASGEREQAGALSITSPGPPGAVAEPAAARAARFAVSFHPTGVAEAWIGLGGTHTAVPIRVWPGHAVGPPAGFDGAGGAPLGRLAAAVEAAVASGRVTAAVVLAALAPVAAEARREANGAERQARLMETPGDDAGAMVRRLVAVSHVAALVETALEALL